MRNNKLLAGGLLLSMAACDAETPLDERARESVEIEAPVARNPTADFAELDHVDIGTDGSAFVISAFNATGELVGRLAIEDLGGAVYAVSSDYRDGGASVVIDTNNDAIVDRQATLGEAVLLERAELIGDLVAQGQGPQAWEGWASCGFTVAATVAACAPTGWWVILSCGAMGATAACECTKAANDGKANYPCGKKKEKKK
jgi:hypothetical protein